MHILCFRVLIFSDFSCFGHIFVSCFGDYLILMCFFQASKGVGVFFMYFLLFFVFGVVFWCFFPSLVLWFWLKLVVWFYWFLFCFFACDSLFRWLGNLCNYIFGFFLFLIFYIFFDCGIYILWCGFWTTYQNAFYGLLFGFWRCFRDKLFLLSTRCY